MCQLPILPTAALCFQTDHFVLTLPTSIKSLLSHVVTASSAACHCSAIKCRMSRMVCCKGQTGCTALGVSARDVVQDVHTVLHLLLYQTPPGSDQFALCLNPWPAAQQFSTPWNSTTDYSTSARSSATCNDDIDALHCNAYHTVLQHHVLHSTLLLYPRNHLDLQAIQAFLFLEWPYGSLLRIQLHGSPVYGDQPYNC